MSFNFKNKKDLQKIILGLAAVALLAFILISSFGKNSAGLGKEKAERLLSLSEIKSICLSVSSTLGEGVLEYKEKSISPEEEFWQWNPTVIADATKIFGNEAGPMLMFGVTTFDSEAGAIANYDQNIKTIEDTFETTNSPKEMTVGDISITDKSFIMFWSEGYGTESAWPKNKANSIIFVKGKNRVMLSDVLGNIVPEVPLNCTQEELIELAKLIEGRI